MLFGRDASNKEYEDLSIDAPWNLII